MLPIKIQTLIVEDDPMVSYINKKFLEQNKHFILVDIAKNGSEAIDYLEKQNIDLILLDVYMPKVDGMELLRYIRSKGYKIDVILITAADSHETIENAMRLGITDCILKPFDNNRFQLALNHYLNRYSIFRSNEIINQNEIDSLQYVVTNNDSKKEQLPKGIDNLTINLIRDILKNSDRSLSAQDLSAHIELSRITVRKYLEYLVENNESTLDLKYSKKGRPTKLYSYGPNHMKLK